MCAWVIVCFCIQCEIVFFKERTYWFSGLALQQISQYISSHPNTLSNNLPFDESTLLKNISNHLSVSKTPIDASQFNSQFQQLLTCVSCFEIQHLLVLIEFKFVFIFDFYFICFFILDKFSKSWFDINIFIHNGTKSKWFQHNTKSQHKNNQWTGCYEIK